MGGGQAQAHHTHMNIFTEAITWSRSQTIQAQCSLGTRLETRTHRVAMYCECEFKAVFEARSVKATLKVVMYEAAKLPRSSMQGT